MKGKKYKTLFIQLYKKFVAVGIIFLLSALVFLGISILKEMKSLNFGKDESLNKINRIVEQLIDDTKDIRTTLELPVPPYETDLNGKNNNNIFTKTNDETPILLSKSNPTDFIFLQTQTVLQQYNKEQITTLFKSTVKLFTPLFTKYNFDIQQKDTRLFIKRNINIVATFDAYLPALQKEGLASLPSSIDSFVIKSSLLPQKENPLLQTSDMEFYLKKLDKTIQVNSKKARSIRNTMISLIKGNNIQSHIKQYNAYITYTNTNKLFIWKLYTALGEQRLRIIVNAIDGTYSINNKTNYIAPISLSLKKIQSTILATDFRVFSDRMSKQRLTTLKKSLFSSSLSTLFKRNNISISKEMRTDNQSDYYYLDIFFKNNNKNTKIGAFAVQKNNGSFWIVDKEDILIQAFHIPLSTKRKPNNQSQIILLVGSHNNLADSIQLAYIDPIKKKIKLLSIPRDLYYSGQKINWYFKQFSIQKFISLLSKILDISISGYISIDMFAFVQVINTLGDIPVYITNDIVDPTYKIKENGEWKTLYYPKGEYMLNGIEVLRIARSRYTTNDFERSKRQQAILSGIQKKVASLNGLTSTLSFAKIIKKIYPYIQTNISVSDMVYLATRYRNAIIETNSLSTKNILYYTFTNLYNNKKNKEDVPENFNYGQYILLPLNNKWENLQHYVRKYLL